MLTLSGLEEFAFIIEANPVGSAKKMTDGVIKAFDITETPLDGYQVYLVAKSLKLKPSVVPEVDPIQRNA